MEPTVAHPSRTTARPALGRTRTGPLRAPGPSWMMVLAGVAATAGLGGAVWVASRLNPDLALRTGALFVHLAALVVGFGAVLVVDWFALLWLLGRRSLAELTNVAAAAHLPIWLGLVGLVLSGVLCKSDLTETLTRIKLGLVLLVTLNGLYTYTVSERLARLGHADGDGPVPPRLLLCAVTSATLSQLGWWGAMLIGFINTQ